MQLHAFLFVGVQTGACLYAAWRGGMPERATAAVMAAAALASAAIPVDHAASFRQLEPARLAVDAVMMLALIGLALRADRFWPLWVAALHLMALTIHGVRAYDATVLPGVYARLTQWAAYPMILLLVIGTHRHRQRVAARGAPERDWSPLVWW